MRAFEVTRTVTGVECPWLSKPFTKGETVYEYRGCTYGCINWQDGLAVSREPGQTPFHQIPRDAIRDLVVVAE